MTILQLAAEIETRILNNAQYKKSYGKKTACVYLEFYYEGERSITYKIYPADWEIIKNLITGLNK